MNKDRIPEWLVGPKQKIGVIKKRQGSQEQKRAQNNAGTENLEFSDWAYLATSAEKLLGTWKALEIEKTIEESSSFFIQEIVPLLDSSFKGGGVDNFYIIFEGQKPKKEHGNVNRFTVEVITNPQDKVSKNPDFYNVRDDGYRRAGSKTAFVVEYSDNVYTDLAEALFKERVELNIPVKNSRIALFGGIVAYTFDHDPLNSEDTANYRNSHNVFSIEMDKDSLLINSLVFPLKKINNLKDVQETMSRQIENLIKTTLSSKK